jgi:hypothetical protein
MKQAFLLIVPILLVNTIIGQSVDITDSDTNTLIQINDEGSQTNKIFYITPYLGSSTLVGNFGIEFQYKNYGYNIGILKSIDVIAIDNILCGGVRYYFKPSHHSWVISVGGGVVLDDLKPDDNLCGPWAGDKPDAWVCETGIVIDKYIGILIGYRWILWNKLQLNVGAGPNYIKWQKIKEGTKHKYLPMVEVVIGYSF